MHGFFHFILSRLLFSICKSFAFISIEWGHCECHVEVKPENVSTYLHLMECFSMKRKASQM